MSTLAPTASSGKVQPKWHVPQGKPSDLKLLNSLTRTKEVFRPANDGKQVVWYSCGPTVYDASHMGHARSYITFDILRRIMMNYFGYDVLMVMNITDVDDKIIYRSRTNYLLKKYEAELGTRAKADTVSEMLDSVSNYQSKIAELPLEDPKRKMMEKVYNAIEGVTSKAEYSAAELFTVCRTPMESWLDTRFGKDITDHAIFAETSQYWEREFHNDMNNLGVLAPHVLTRVTEYLPEIVEYVKQIISNGYGYESNGSVYFDSAKWRADRGYLAKLKPESVGDLDALAEGEGQLSSSDSKEKKNQVDFALWKASKPGEPEWESPWGKGRPGWHIECSCMADAICDGVLDIHSGGEDLCFPHHDNEILQAEAHADSKQWVNYFLHTGHLSIEGCKMSKSLKNFISIKEALKKNTARQLRLHFLSHTWHAGLDYSESAMSEAVTTERTFKDFFLLVKYHKSSLGEGPESFTKYTASELILQKQLEKCQDTVHKALSDNFDTPTVMKALKSVVSDTYSYLSSNKCPNVRLLIQVAVYVTDILRVFGVVESEDKIGFQSEGSTVSSDDVILPFVKTLSEFRDEMRSSARELKATPILQCCDRLRDDVLPELGIRLEDREIGEPAVFKIDDKDTLLKEKKLRIEEKERKEKEKKEKAEARDKLAREKLEKGKMSPKEMFLSQTDKFSAWDELGMPTLDVKGEKVAASQLKKLKKLQQVQEKLHTQYLQSISDLEI